MGGALLIVAAVAPAHAACPDADDAVEAAKNATLELDFEAAEDALLDVEDALGCGEDFADPELLARMWLVEGALATMRRQPEDAALALAAARRVSPDLFMEELGPQVRRAWERTSATNPALGHVKLAPSMEGYRTAVDGKEVVFPLDESAGLHVIQVAEDGVVRFAKLLVVFENDEHLVETGLPDRTLLNAPRVVPDPEPEVAPPEPRQPVAELHLAVGASAFVGEALALTRRDGAVLEEPALKLTIPVEAGLTLTPGGLWARGVVTVHPLIGGRYLYYDPDTDVEGSGFGLGGHFSGGASFGSGRVGALAGGTWPGRLAFRAAAGVGLGELPLRAELRAGVNIATERTPEPGASVVFGYAPSF